MNPPPEMALANIFPKYIGDLQARMMIASRNGISYITCSIGTKINSLARDSATNSTA
jgi:hypothetical protein